MKKLISIITVISFCSPWYAEQYNQIDKIDLPKIQYSETQNEIEELSEKPRSPSNTDNTTEDSYQAPPSEVQIWDYQRVIDRNDRH